MFSQTPRRQSASGHAAHQLSATELDAIVGGTTAGTASPGSTQKNPSLLVVIAIIAILIG